MGGKKEAGRRSKALLFARSHVIMNVSARVLAGKQNSHSVLRQERLNIRNGDTGAGGRQEGSTGVNSELMRTSKFCPKDYGNRRQKMEVPGVAA